MAAKDCRESQYTIVKTTTIMKDFTWKIENLTGFEFDKEQFLLSKTLTIEEFSLALNFKLLFKSFGPCFVVPFTSPRTIQLEIMLDNKLMSYYSDSLPQIRFSFEDFFDKVSNTHTFDFKIKCTAMDYEDKAVELLEAPADPENIEEFVIVEEEKNQEAGKVSTDNESISMLGESSCAQSTIETDNEANDDFEANGEESQYPSDEEEFDSMCRSCSTAQKTPKFDEVVTAFLDPFLKSNWLDVNDEESKEKLAAFVVDLQAFTTLDNYAEIIYQANENEFIKDFIVKNFIVKQNFDELRFKDQWLMLKANEDLYKDIVERIIGKLLRKVVIVI